MVAELVVRQSEETGGLRLVSICLVERVLNQSAPEGVDALVKGSFAAFDLIL